MQIVLIPGLLCDASVWDAQVAALAPFADVVVADVSRQSSIEAMAHDALALRRGPITVVGHSMGARVALAMVAEAPDRVERLGLFDTGAHPRREGEEKGRQAMLDVAERDGMAGLAATWLPPMVGEAGQADAGLMARLRAMVLRATPEQHARQIKALLNRPNAEPLLPTIRCPTLVLVGRQDRWSSLPQHEAIAAAIPHATLVVVENSGHMVTVEQPEAVTRAMIDWLGLDIGTDTLPQTMIFERQRGLRGYKINKMAMSLTEPANRVAFLADEEAFLDRFDLEPEQKRAVMARDWREMVRLGGNLFFILKISAVDPVRITEIGAAQAGMDHGAFLRDRLGKA